MDGTKASPSAGPDQLVVEEAASVMRDAEFIKGLLARLNRIEQGLDDRAKSSADEVMRVLAGETIADTGVKWADTYMDIYEKLLNGSRAGQTLGQDTTKEVAALILVQLMEKHA